MKIKSVHLENYKRFTNLRIENIPEATRLVVLIGPNGTGKSSLFDAFLLKSRSASRYNYHLDDTLKDYYVKENSLDNSIGTTQEMSNTINVEFHTGEPAIGNCLGVFNIRSAYRNESDFQVTTLERVTPSKETVRLQRIIDIDQAVSENYRRMTWKRMADLDRDAHEDTTFGQYRKESLGELQEAMEDLFSNPTLELQDFGGIRDSGVFRFSKGNSDNFHYKNLSGGEKAAFDLLLDIFVKREEYQDAIYCIDEPEAHVATGIHGSLLEAMLKLVPEESQLWIATHSVGFVRKAYDIMRQNKNDIVFLDFSKHDFDKEVMISPREPDRSFWHTTYQVALDDLAELIAPSNVIICEGSTADIDKGFDAACYNRIFEDSHPDSLFISQGGASQVEKSENIIEIIHAVAKGVNVWRLIDRDDMTEEARKQDFERGIHVLRRREIENYLYDPEVLRTFLVEKNMGSKVTSVQEYQKCLLECKAVAVADVKKVSRDLFDYIKNSTGLSNLGNTRKEFAIQHLTKALKQTPCVYQELCEDVFP